MKLKKFLPVLLAIITAFSFAGCKPESEKKNNPEAGAVSAAAVKLINWYKSDQLESGGDLSALDSDEDGYSGRQLARNNIRAMAIAKYFGVTADYDAFSEKLGTSLSTLYPDTAALCGASNAYLNEVVFYLDNTGGDAADFNGKNILAAGTYDNTRLFDIYSTPTALEVLKNRTLADAEKAYIDETIEAIAAEQLSNGGFGYVYEGIENADADTTAMVLMGVGLYKDSNEKAAAVCSKAIDYLLLKQNDDGTFNGFSGKSSSSTALVISALCALSIDPYTDARFIKNGRNIVDSLINTFSLDGGFMAAPDSGVCDVLSAKDVLRAFYDLHKFLTK